MTTNPSTLAQIWRLIVWQRRAYWVNAFFWTSVFTLPLLRGLIAKGFFDALSRQPAGINTLSFVALTLAVGGVSGAAVFGGVVVNAPFRFRIGGLLRRNVFEQLLEKRGAAPLGAPLGDAISTLRDDTDIAVDGVDWTLDIVGRTVFVAVALAILFSINARLTALVFIPLIVVLSLTYLLGARLERLRRAARTSTARVTTLIAEMFGSTQSIQVACAEQRVVAHFRKLGAERQGAVLRDTVTAQTLEAIYGNVVSLGTGVILLLVAGQMRSGEFSVGDFAVFAAYLAEVAGITQFFGHFLNTYRQTGVSFNRMTALFPSTASSHALTAPRAMPLIAVPDVKPATPSHAAFERLEVRDLSCSFGNARGIRKASFTVRRGSFTVITGRIGSGKTTLLRAVVGLLQPTGGEVLWNGINCDTLEPPRVAYTAQNPTLLSDTILENILLGESHDVARLERSIFAAVLDADIPSFEHGLQTQIGAKGVKLSGGQLSRVAAARMLYRDAELLVFDDLSSALDVGTEAALWERLALGGATALVVSHRRAALQQADQIVLLLDGEVIAVGSLEHLLAHHVEMQRLWSGEL